MYIKKFLFLLTAVFYSVNLNAGKDVDPVSVLHGASAVSTVSAIASVAVSGVAAIVVISTPAMVNSVSSSKSSSSANNTDEKLEVSDEIVTSYDFKKNKENK